jgi:ATP-dependent Zn protease
MGGWVARRMEGRAGTRSEIETEIAILLAGRVAEELVLGEGSAGAGGVRGSDLDQATRLAAGLVGSFGLAGPTRLLFVSPVSDTREILSHAHLRRATTQILEQAHRRARDHLVAHRAALDRIVEQLIETRYLGGEALAELIVGETHKPTSARPSRARGRPSDAIAEAGEESAGRSGRGAGAPS